jgi:hypothetical protein
MYFVKTTSQKEKNIGVFSQNQLFVSHDERFFTFTHPGRMERYF